MKRVIDLLIAICGLIVFGPVILMTALLIKLNIGAPILFKQVRPGLHGRPFVIYKFRTMTDERDETGELLPDLLRLTSLGKTIRKLSLDELPQLLNVLKGDMSFVGPRPLLFRYVSYYTAREQKRHSVRPGITGLAQVKGRNNLKWDERLEFDVQYVENYSLLLDFKIMVLTLVKVSKKEGMVIDPRSTMLDLDKERIRRLTI